MNTVNEEFLWTEKYRPHKIDNCVLPNDIKSVFKNYVSESRIPNLLLVGSAGCGKTTVARALCDEIGVDYIFINASNETGIDTFRSKILQFASTVSLTDSKKVVILDEFDYSSGAMQAALRAGMEELSNNCTFILTCNFKNRIIEPLHSRCAVIDFKLSSKDKTDMAGRFFKHAVKILKEENVEYDQKVVADLIIKHFPDYRRMINELQRYSVSGKIDSGILINLSNESYKQLYNLMKDKNFTEVRKWVAQNSNNDYQSVFRELYDSSNNILDISSVPQLILILADYSYKSAFVADQELNLMAALTEVMGSCKFK